MIHVEKGEQGRCRRPVEHEATGESEADSRGNCCYCYFCSFCCSYMQHAGQPDLSRPLGQAAARGKERGCYQFWGQTQLAWLARRLKRGG